MNMSATSMLDLGYVGALFKHLYGPIMLKV